MESQFQKDSNSKEAHWRFRLTRGRSHSVDKGLHSRALGAKQDEDSSYGFRPKKSAHQAVEHAALGEGHALAQFEYLYQRAVGRHPVVHAAGDFADLGV